MNQYVANFASHVHEDRLRKCLAELFPGYKLLVNSQDHNIRYAETGRPMELDIWFPELDLCFEFQDSYHYVTTWYKPHTLQNIRRRDDFKQAELHRHNITLLKIPCWWDGTIGSLAGTITFNRPDLLHHSNPKLISLNAAHNYFIIPEIPTISELMLASFANEVASPSPFEWWLGEKYDGVRCYWDLSTQEAYTRHGNEISILPSIKQNIPKMSIDCELWYGRGQYGLSFHLVNKTILFFWESFRMVTFDMIPSSTLKVPFEDRYIFLLEHISDDHPFSIVPFRAMYHNDVQLKRFSEGIILLGGEGVILRKLASHYELGRSLSLLKLKTGSGDKEAIVVDIEDDGSLRLKLPNGKTFTVPSKDVNLAQRPSVGDIVSFSYEENSRLDIPNHPSVFRIRTDVTWDDVIAGHLLDKPRANETNFQTKPLNYWTTGNKRTYLEEIASSMNLDPLLASTWYTINRTKLLDFEGGTSILHTFKGSFQQNIQDLFPEVDFQFDYVFFAEPRNRREFFVKYAKKKGFDPLVPSNWYRQLMKHILAEQGGRPVLEYYRGKVRQALIALFPEIGLEESKFRIFETWKSKSKRREVMNQFAKAYNFDPLIAANWKTTTTKRFIAFSKNANTILKYYYKSSLDRAVLDCYPEISYPPYEKKGQSWTNPQDRKAFFVHYARKRGFDPLVATNWYSLTGLQIQAEKGAFGVLAYHNKDFREALIDLFPDIGLFYKKFSTQRIPRNL